MKPTFMQRLGEFKGSCEPSQQSINPCPISVHSRSSTVEDTLGSKISPKLGSDEDDISVLINRQIRGIINCHHEGVSGAHELSVHTQLFECVIKCLTF